MAERYELEYGEDPRPWLKDIDCMSDEISEEGENEEEREMFRTQLARKAGLTPQEVEAKVNVWEVVRPAHRAEAVSRIHLSKFSKLAHQNAGKCHHGST